MLTEIQRKQLRQIPAIHELLQADTMSAIENEGQLNKEILTLLCQEQIQEIRKQILQGQMDEASSIVDIIFTSITNKIDALLHSPLKPLINGTGVVLHTNLGRAKLSKEAQLELANVATYYSNLEFNLTEGTRGSRHSIVEEIICQLTGAEAALVCNNNASAVFLTLRELAYDQEVIVSRGELVEIGGSFRVSEIMRESGAKLVEVGTTNKTHLYDYERAITEDTGLVMKVHTSNFVVKGFTASVTGTDLVDLAHQHHIPVFEDLGSGVLFDLRPHGIGDEPTVQEVLSEGVDIVSFSGDKLLGGPQAGIVAGKKAYIDRLKKNQLMRSLRVDKFTLAALHATLKAYFHPEKAAQDIPTLHMILQDEATIKKKAEHFVSTIDDSLYSCRLVNIESEVGGGTMPEVKLPSWGVEIISHRDKNVAFFSRRLRLAPFPVIGRVHNDRFILDFRTITEEEIPLIVTSMTLQTS
jgi:L-seryl-tRNA(Ser) seleniumtransferase